MNTCSFVRNAKRKARCVAWATQATSVRVITRKDRFDISMSPSEVPTSIARFLTNVHYGCLRRLLRLFVLAIVAGWRARGRWGPERNAATRISRRRGRKGPGTGRRLFEAQRAPAGLLIAIMVNNLVRQEASGCIGERSLRQKALFRHSDRELSRVHSDCWNASKLSLLCNWIEIILKFVVRYIM